MKTDVKTLEAKTKTLNNGKTKIEIFLNGKKIATRTTVKKVTHATFRQSYHLHMNEWIEKVTFHSNEKQAYTKKNGTLFGELISEEREIHVIEL